MTTPKYTKGKLVVVNPHSYAKRIEIAGPDYPIAWADADDIDPKELLE